MGNGTRPVLRVAGERHMPDIHSRRAPAAPHSIPPPPPPRPPPPPLPPIPTRLHASRCTPAGCAAPFHGSTSGAPGSCRSWRSRRACRGGDVGARPGRGRGALPVGPRAEAAEPGTPRNPPLPAMGTYVLAHNTAGRTPTACLPARACNRRSERHLLPPRTHSWSPPRPIHGCTSSCRLPPITRVRACTHVPLTRCCRTGWPCRWR